MTNKLIILVIFIILLILLCTSASYGRCTSEKYASVPPRYGYPLQDNWDVHQDQDDPACHIVQQDTPCPEGYYRKSFILNVQDQCCKDW